MVCMARKRAKLMTPKQIRELRESLKLDRDQFGEMLGVTFRQVYAWEAGERVPSGPALVLLHILKKSGKI